MITLLPPSQDNSLIRLLAGPQWGKQSVGISPGGFADRFSAAVANQLVGREHNDALYEITLTGGGATVTRDGLIAFNGASLVAYCDEEVIPNHQSIRIKKGQSLRWEAPINGARAYLAFNASSLSPKEHSLNHPLKKRQPWGQINHWMPPKQRIRILWAPESTNDTLDYLCSRPWQISPQSNTQGLRLISEGDAPIISTITSAPVQDGTIQLTPNGPIVLLRDRQTVGGYPRIGQVIDCDVDVLGQYRSGQRFRFSQVSLPEALTLQQQQKTALKNAVFEI